MLSRKIKEVPVTVHVDTPYGYWSDHYSAKSTLHVNKNLTEEKWEAPP